MSIFLTVIIPFMSLASPLCGEEIFSENPAPVFKKAPLVPLKDLKQTPLSLPAAVVRALKTIARANRLERSAMLIVLRLSTTVPEVFGRIEVHPKNLEDHADKHAIEFSPTGERLIYFERLDRFINQREPNDVYLSTGLRQVKFNMDSGEILVLSPEGRFITFYRTADPTPAERVEKFINQAAAFEKKAERSQRQSSN